MQTLKILLGGLILISLMACQTGGGGGGSITGNEAGSQPSNDVEASEYQRAVNRCHRTGGTRVVKIMGELRCY
jgi:hypothetical protein